MESDGAGLDRRSAARPIGEFSMRGYTWNNTLRTTRAFLMSHGQSFFNHRIPLSVS
jgi:hypothetical protein